MSEAPEQDIWQSRTDGTRTLHSIRPRPLDGYPHPTDFSLCETGGPVRREIEELGEEAIVISAAMINGDSSRVRDYENLVERYFLFREFDRSFRGQADAETALQAVEMTLEETTAEIELAGHPAEREVFLIEFTEWIADRYRSEFDPAEQPNGDATSFAE